MICYSLCFFLLHDCVPEIAFLVVRLILFLIFSNGPDIFTAFKKLVIECRTFSQILFLETDELPITS